MLPRSLAWLLPTFAWACSTSSPPAPAPSALTITPSCGASAADAADTADAAMCLAGTVTTTDFTASVQSIGAFLYAVFPSGAQPSLAMQTVPSDGVWAFGGLSPNFNYYVEFVVAFAGLAQPLTQIVGPLRASENGLPVTVAVKPVQIDALESRPAGGVQSLQWARAHVFDPSTGVEVTLTAAVSITAGGVVTAMPWIPEEQAYFIQFAPPPAADLTYVVTTSDPSLGSAARTWQLVAAPPAFDGTITAPAADASVPTNEDLLVTWTEQPEAAGESVELFERDVQADPWTQTYPPPGGGTDTASDVTMQLIPAASLSAAGQYLLNVAYLTANCPVTADGCVSAAAVAAIQFRATDGGAADAQAD